MNGRFEWSGRQWETVESGEWRHWRVAQLVVSSQKLRWREKFQYPPNVS